MTQKTALTELIGQLKQSKQTDVSSHRGAYDSVILKAEALLPKERQDLIEANIKGSEGSLANFKQMGIAREVTAEKYVKQKFGI